jgi:hypothetical protein
MHPANPLQVIVPLDPRQIDGEKAAEKIATKYDSHSTRRCD